MESTAEREVISPQHFSITFLLSNAIHQNILALWVTPRLTIPAIGHKKCAPAPDIRHPGIEQGHLKPSIFQRYTATRRTLHRAHGAAAGCLGAEVNGDAHIDLLIRRPRPVKVHCLSDLKTHDYRRE
jgi:hypothetical protein